MMSICMFIPLSGWAMTTGGRTSNELSYIWILKWHLELLLKYIKLFIKKLCFKSVGKKPLYSFRNVIRILWEPIYLNLTHFIILLESDSVTLLPVLVFLTLSL